MAGRGEVRAPARCAPARWRACPRGRASSIRVSASRRPIPRCSNACTVSACQEAPLRPLLHTLLDDAQVAVADGGRHAPALEPLVRERQQPPQHELVDGDLADPRPVEVGVEAEAGALAEVLLRRREGHLRPDRAFVLGQHAQGAVVEGGVREHVDHGRPRGQHAVLDAHVRLAVDDVVDRPVPAVDGAVVQPQLLQPRGPARLELGDRVLVARPPAAATGSTGRSPRTGRRSK